MTCAHCSAPLRTSNKRQRFCSVACGNAARRKCVPKPCAHCGDEFTPRDADARYCSRACYGAGLVDNEPAYLAGVRVTHARNDMALIGAVFCAWAGEPVLLSELAARIGEPEMATWAGLLAPWVEAINTDAGPLLYARTCSSADVRAAVAKHTRVRAENAHRRRAAA